MIKDYDTDESMKEIDFNDIKDDQSDHEEDTEKIQHKHEALEKLGNFSTPAEYYKNLRIKREKAAQDALIKNEFGNNLINYINNSFVRRPIQNDVIAKNYKSKYAEDLEGSD
jgi:hypothetical protein